MQRTGESPVRSTPMVDGRVSEEERGRIAHTPPRPRARAGTAIPIAGLAIGCLLWPIGGRYSIDGLFWLINAILVFLRIPIALITPPHWAFYCLLAPLPYLCSRVEWRAPVYREAGRWRIAAANVVVTWICVAGYDLGTTYLGVRAPTQGSAIGAEVAAGMAVAVILSAILTFGPEWLARTSWRQLMRG